MPGDCGIPGCSRTTTDSRATTTAANSPSTGARSRIRSRSVVRAPGACRSTPSGSRSIGQATGGDSRSDREPHHGLGLPLVPRRPRPGARRPAPADGAGRVGGRAGSGAGAVPGVWPTPGMGAVGRPPSVEGVAAMRQTGARHCRGGPRSWLNMLPAGPLTLSLAPRPRRQGTPDRTEG
jgi:hypothetical protein